MQICVVCRGSSRNFIWVGQSKAKQILGRPTGVVYVGIMGMTRTVCLGQSRVWVGHGLPGLIAGSASGSAYAVKMMCCKLQLQYV